MVVNRVHITSKENILNLIRLGYFKKDIICIENADVRVI